jgi:hypothetical protein
MLPYDGYVTAMEQEMQKAGAVTMAVIGEIALREAAEDAIAAEDGWSVPGATVEAVVRLKAIDYTTGREIAAWEERDALRRQSLPEAQRFVLEKAASRAAKSLADRVLAAWRENS